MKVSYVKGHTTVELDDEMKSSITYTKDRMWVSQASPEGYKRIRLTRELVKLIKEIDLR